MKKIEFNGYVNNVSDSCTADALRIIGKHLRRAFLEIQSVPRMKGFDADYDAGWFESVKQLYHIKVGQDELLCNASLNNSDDVTPFVYSSAQAAWKKVRYIADARASHFTLNGKLLTVVKAED